MEESWLIFSDGNSGGSNSDSNGISTSRSNVTVILSSSTSRSSKIICNSASSSSGSNNRIVKVYDVDNLNYM